MCTCATLESHAATTRYVNPAEGDFVFRYDPHGRYAHLGAGLLCVVDAYAGGLPRAHVLFEDGTVLVECLFLFQDPAFAVLDPCWYDFGPWA